jgi:outer membrane protein assembly factor BamB
MVWAALVAVAAVALSGCIGTEKTTPTADLPAIKALPSVLAAQGLVLYWTSQWPLDDGESVARINRLPGRLYAVTNHNRVLAMDSRTGQFLWDADLGSPGLSVTPVSQMGDKMILLAVGDRLYGLDPVTGKTVLKRWLERSPSTRLVCQGDYIYFGTNEGRLEAVDVADPAKSWSRWTPAAILAAPAADASQVYVANIAGDLTANSFKNRVVRWTYPRGGRIGGVNGDLSLSTGGLVLVPSRDYSLYAMNPVGGQPAWVCTTGNPITKAAHSVGDRIYFVTQTHVLFCVKEAGGEKPLWTADGINDFVAAGPSLAFVRSVDGDLLALDPETGALKFRVPTAGLNRLVTNNLDSQIFADDAAGHVICLREAKGQFDLKPELPKDEAPAVQPTVRKAAPKPAPAAEPKPAAEQK